MSKQLFSRQFILAVMLGAFSTSEIFAAQFDVFPVPLPPTRPSEIQGEAPQSPTPLPVSPQSVPPSGAALSLCKGNDSRKWDNCVGTFQIENLGEYQGEIRNHRPEGSGVFRAIDGSVYQGEFHEGVPSGKGRFTSAKGAVYIGEFADGVANGQGSEQASDGARYTGDYVNGVREGKGKLNFTDGREYEGDFKSDHIEGYGTYNFPNGNSYTGVFFNDEPTDRGIFRFANGDRYVGAYREFKPSGQGVFTFAAGHKLIGAFVDGAPKGPGVLYDNNGELIFEGDLSGFDTVEKIRTSFEAKKIASSTTAVVPSNQEAALVKPLVKNAPQESSTPASAATVKVDIPVKATSEQNNVVVTNVVVAPLDPNKADVTIPPVQPTSDPLPVAPQAQAPDVNAATNAASPQSTPQLNPAPQATPKDAIAILEQLKVDSKLLTPEPAIPVVSTPTPTTTPKSTAAPLQCKRSGDLLVSFITCTVTVPQVVIEEFRFVDHACRSGSDYLAEYDASRNVAWYNIIRMFKAHFYFAPFDYRGVHRYREDVHLLVSECNSQGPFMLRVNGAEWTWPINGDPVLMPDANASNG